MLSDANIRHRLLPSNRRRRLLTSHPDEVDVYARARGWVCVGVMALL